jgi:hypothetical protein
MNYHMISSSPSSSNNKYEPAHEPLVVTSAEVNVKAEPQASVAVATANTGNRTIDS